MMDKKRNIDESRRHLVETWHEGQWHDHSDPLIAVDDNDGAKPGSFEAKLCEWILRIERRAEHKCGHTMLKGGASVDPDILIRFLEQGSEDDKAWVAANPKPVPAPLTFAARVKSLNPVMWALTSASSRTNNQWCLCVQTNSATGEIESGEILIADKDSKRLGWISLYLGANGFPNQVINKGQSMLPADAPVEQAQVLRFNVQIPAPRLSRTANGLSITLDQFFSDLHRTVRDQDLKRNLPHEGGEGELYEIIDRVKSGEMPQKRL